MKNFRFNFGDNMWVDYLTLDILHAATKLATDYPELLNRVTSIEITD